MAEDQELSAEQSEKLIHFQELTGIDDLQLCRELLYRNNWDLEVAVQNRLSEEEGTSSIFQYGGEEQEPTPEPPRVQAVDLNPVNQRALTINSYQSYSLRQWGYFLITFPFNFIYSTFLDIFLFFYRIFKPDPRMIVTDPLGDVLQFAQHFNDTYGDTHPVFYPDTYSQALNEAKQELRFLLVYLHRDNHRDCDQFARNTLCNRRVSNFIDARTLFWACSTSSPEGYRVSQTLRCHVFPTLALIVLKQNRMTVVARVEGPIDGVEMVARLARIMDENETSLLAVRMDREERSFNQTLREEQDQAYMESLRADQDKERMRLEEQCRQQIAEQAKKDHDLNTVKKLQEIQRKKDELRDQLPVEPDVDDVNAVKISLKLPNGTRLERRFLKTDSLKCLYNFVFVHEAAPDDFQIVANFPRKVLPCQPTESVPEPPTFEQFGLGKSELLFVHDNEA